MKTILIGLLSFASLSSYANICDVALKIEAREHIKLSQKLAKKAIKILERKGYRVTTLEEATSNIVIKVDIQKQNLVRVLTSNTQPPEGVGYNRVILTQTDHQTGSLIYGMVFDQGYSAGPFIERKSLNRMTSLLQQMKDCKELL